MPFDGTKFKDDSLAPKTLADDVMKAPMTGRQRLAMLADFLDTVPPEKFSLCGWAACACGWADKIPAFQADGYSCSGGAGPRLGNIIGAEALVTFFDITLSNVCNFFVDSRYPTRANTTPTQVADRIRAYLAEQVQS